MEYPYFLSCVLEILFSEMDGIEMSISKMPICQNVAVIAYAKIHVLQVYLILLYLHCYCNHLRLNWHTLCSSFLDGKHLPVMWSKPCWWAEQRRSKPITFFVYWRLREVGHLSQWHLRAGPPTSSTKRYHNYLNIKISQCFSSLDETS